MARHVWQSILLSLAFGTGIAAAQSPQRIVVVTPHHEGDAGARRWEGNLGKAISARGYREGRDFVVEPRHTAYDIPKLKAVLSEVAGTQPAVIVCVTAECALRASEATRSVPIVFAIYTDPVADGLVDSLAKPGANMTGVVSYLPVEAKQMELLALGFSSVRRVVVLDDEDDPLRPAQRERLSAGARAAGLREDYCLITAGAPDFALARCGRIAEDTAVYVPISNRFFARAADLAAALNRTGQPAMYEFSGYVKAGGLFTLEPKRRQAHEDIAYLVDRIMRGTPPGALPIIRPRETRIVVNSQAMGMLRHPLSPGVLKRAELVSP